MSKLRTVKELSVRELEELPPMARYGLLEDYKSETRDKEGMTRKDWALILRIIGLILSGLATDALVNRYIR